MQGAIDDLTSHALLDEFPAQPRRPGWSQRHPSPHPGFSEAAVVEEAHPLKLIEDCVDDLRRVAAAPEATCQFSPSAHAHSQQAVGHLGGPGRILALAQLLEHPFLDASASVQA